ncbi:hypothetical protein LWM68_41045 [Niabella sp. W65]|nr:hypothetical protein [Niabella sp. W65]MCH7368561.1 hypothetical protein [Niabella sp. W65]
MDEEMKRVVIALRCYEIDYEGNRIQGEVNKEYQRMLVADNQTGVDPATGDYVQPLPALVDGSSYPTDIVLLGGKMYPAGTIGEFDYFNNIQQHVPVIIEQLKIAVLTKNRNRLMPDGLLAEPEPETEE